MKPKQLNLTKPY